MAALIIFYLSISLCFYLLIKFFHKVWWTPIRIQSRMNAQGIKGPPYRFFYGNTKEMLEMRKAALSSPLELSHHNIFPRIQPHIYVWTKLYGMNYLNWYGTQAQLVVTEPELIKQVLENKGGAYSRIDGQGISKKLLGDGLAMSDGEKWFKMRKLANHAFCAESLKDMTPAMIASVEMMLERWRQFEGKEIDVFQEFKVLTSEVISRTAFGSSYLEGQQIFHMLTKMIVVIFRSIYKVRIPGIGRFVRTQDDIEAKKLGQGIRDSIMRIINKREEEAMLGKEDNYGSDFLGFLLKAHHEADETKKISVDDLIDECKTFYVAGQETASSLLSWTIFLLAIHTDWQDKARAEVLESFGHENPTSEGLSRLKTMSMIVNETLRLYSPTPIFAKRKTRKDVRLGTILVPANMEVSISTLAVHNNPEIWGEDVHLFKPERFTDGVAKATNNSSAAFLPFGLGPRICVGSNFARTETKLALSMILQRYRFTLSQNYVHSPFPLVTMCPRHGLQVILQPL